MKAFVGSISASFIVVQKRIESSDRLRTKVLSEHCYMRTKVRIVFQRQTPMLPESWLHQIYCHLPVCATISLLQHTCRWPRVKRHHKPAASGTAHCPEGFWKGIVARRCQIYGGQLVLSCSSTHKDLPGKWQKAVSTCALPLNLPPGQLSIRPGSNA